MNTIAELQLQLHQIVDTVKDEEKLSAIVTLLKGSTGPFTPMNLDEYMGAIDGARQQMKEGKSLSVEDLEKEVENW